MPQHLEAGDFLIFQLEAGFALLRLLAVDDDAWHVAAYGDFYPSVEAAEAAIEAGPLRLTEPHVALTTRAFESTQVAKIGHMSLTDNELTPLAQWHDDPDRQVSDRSIRLMLGLR